MPFKDDEPSKICTFCLSRRHWAKDCPVKPLKYDVRMRMPRSEPGDKEGGNQPE